jgi:hypothetical protein
MGPRNAYKDMLDKLVSRITCVSMNHQNQLEQMANGAMFSARSHLLEAIRGADELWSRYICDRSNMKVYLND